MKKEKLKQYRGLTKEIARLERAIEKHYAELEALPAIPGKVEGSRSEHPYTLQSIPVMATDATRADEIKRQIKRKKYRIKINQQKVKRIEKYISGIDDSINRQIFEMIFLDGMSYENVANVLRYSKTAVAMRVKRHFENVNNVNV